jgi:hypothetical protein
MLFHCRIVNFNYKDELIPLNEALKFYYAQNFVRG